MFWFIPPLLALGLTMTAEIYKNNKKANAYSQDYYSRQKQAYENLWRGQQEFYKKQGLSINPDRAWTSYYGTLQGINNNLYQNSINSQNLDYGLAKSGASYAYGATHLYDAAKPKRRF